MDEAISFLRQFLDALYRMSHAKLSEPDWGKTALWDGLRGRYAAER